MLQRQIRLKHLTKTAKCAMIIPNHAGFAESLREKRVKNKVDFWTHLYKGS